MFFFVKKMIKILVNFLRDEQGASLVEYTLLLGVISVAIAVVINTYRGDLSRVFVNAGNAVNQ